MSAVVSVLLGGAGRPTGYAAGAGAVVGGVEMAFRLAAATYSWLSTDCFWEVTN